MDYTTTCKPTGSSRSCADLISNATGQSCKCVISFNLTESFEVSALKALVLVIDTIPNTDIEWEMIM